MPFKSDQQRKMFFARAQISPKWAKMDKHWAAATPKGKRLPHRVGEQLGPDNDEIPVVATKDAPDQRAAFEGVESRSSPEDQLDLTTTKRALEHRLPTMLEVFRRKLPWS